MKKRIPFLLALLLAGSAALADEDAGIGPWRLGMSREQVVAIADFAPYEDDAAHGTLATANAKFSGHPADAVLAFGAGSLRSVQLRTYAGKDWRKASEAVVAAFELFAANVGGANVKEVQDNVDRKAMDQILERTLGTAEEIHKKYARAGSYAIITFDMVPRRQPGDSRLQCQWVYDGKSNTYTVYLYQDLPGAPARDAPDNIQLEKL